MFSWAPAWPESREAHPLGPLAPGRDIGVGVGPGGRYANQGRGEKYRKMGFSAADLTGMWSHRNPADLLLSLSTTFWKNQERSWSDFGFLTKKKVQLYSCKLSFIWGKMSTASQETAPQRALRDCSKEVVEQGQYIRFWWRVKVKVKLLSRVQLFETPWSLPVFSIHGIFQARVPEWVAISFFRGSSWPRDQTLVSRIAGRRFTLWDTREAHGEGGIQCNQALISQGVFCRSPFCWCHHEGI